MPSSSRAQTTSTALKVPAQVGTALVSAHEDDLLGPQEFHRQHSDQADGAVPRTVTLVRAPTTAAWAARPAVDGTAVGL